jgi:hypothetical protein
MSMKKRAPVAKAVEATSTSAGQIVQRMLAYGDAPFLGNPSGASGF